MSHSQSAGSSRRHMVVGTRRLLPAALMAAGWVTEAHTGQSQSSPIVPLVAIPEVATAPVIDGRIDPTEWGKAADARRPCAVTCAFRDTGFGRAGSPARAPTVVYLCYDARALYCLFECQSPHEDLGKWVGRSTYRDAALDSPVDLMLSPEKWPATRYACFAVSASGGFADRKCDKGAADPSWNPDWEHIAASENDRWFAEMAIPWRVLDLEQPEPGTVLRANFGRSVLSLSERSTWGGAYELEKASGKIVLAGTGPVAAIPDVFVTLPGALVRSKGRATVQARLLGEAQTARLDVRLAGGAQARKPSHSCGFKRTSEGDCSAAVTLEAPVGSSVLEVSVRSNGERLLWHHTLPLDVPDLLSHIRSMRSTLGRVMGRSTVGFTTADVTDLRSRLLELEANARKPLGADGLIRISETVGEVAYRVEDLGMLVRSQQNVRRQDPHGELPSYYVTNPACTRKIQPASVDPGLLASVLRVAMAKGEYEAAQVVVCAVGKDLKGVQVSASALRGPKGRAIPNDRVVVTPLGFVRIGVPSKDAPLVDMVPDVLFPNRATDIPAGRRQPFLITVQTTAQDKPGEYRGTAQIAAGNCGSTTLPLVVRVHDVALPVRSHLRTLFVVWGHSMGPYLDDYRVTFREYVEKRSAYLESLSPDERNAYLETYIRHSKSLLAYRVSPAILCPISMWFPKKLADGSWDFSEIDRYLSALAPLGLTTFNVGGPPIYDPYVGRTGEVTPEHAAFVKAAAAHLRERGWWDLHYVYGYDEASRSMLDKLRANYGTLVEAVPDLRIMQTAWSPDPVLKGLVRIWCPLTQYANMEAIQGAQRAGEEVWWYVCCSPTRPYANVFIDYPGIDQRLLGWMTYRYGIQGFLYWGVDWWMWNAPPLSKYVRENFSRWGATYPGGDGSLLYPAAEGELPLPSLRLALLRDGFEDYDLFTEVNALAARGGRRAERARKLLSLDALIRSLTDYTQDEDEVFARREAVLRVGEELTRYKRGGGGRPP